MVYFETVSLKLGVLFGGLAFTVLFILALFGLAVFRQRYIKFAAISHEPWILREHHEIN